MLTMILSVLGKANKGWLAAALVIVSLTGLYYYGQHRIVDLRAQVDRLTAEKKVGDDKLYLLETQVRTNERIAAVRKEQIRNLEVENAGFKKKLEDIYANDEKARAWAGTVVPDNVFNCVLASLRESDRERFAACALPGGSAGTGAGGPDK